MKRFALACLVCCGCGGSGSTPDAGILHLEAFIALGIDFTDFEQWRRFDLGIQEANSVHFAGKRDVYLNKTPAPGGSSFPVGTILVKVVTVEADGGPAARQVFAMAKRGGTFNSEGAAGWEWFELAVDGPSPVVTWRGALPPPKQGYGGGIGGACNECHTNVANDFVLATELSLKSL